MPAVETPYGALFFAEHKATENALPFVLIHGAGSSHLAWPRELRRLPGQRTLAIDLPAHGRSMGQAQASIAAYAKAVLALLDAMNIAQCIPIGHSMGGAIALELTLIHPERVAGLVLIGNGAKLPVNADILNTVLEDKARVAALINKWAWAPHIPDEMREKSMQVMMDTPAAVLHGDYTACNTFDVRHRLKDIAAPTLVICGTADKMTPLRFSQLLVDEIPNAALHILEGAGHWITLEQPAAVAQAIEAWLVHLIEKG